MVIRGCANVSIVAHFQPLVEILQWNGSLGAFIVECVFISRPPHPPKSEQTRDPPDELTHLECADAPVTQLDGQDAHRSSGVCNLLAMLISACQEKDLRPFGNSLVRAAIRG